MAGLGFLQLLLSELQDCPNLQTWFHITTFYSRGKHLDRAGIEASYSGDCSNPDAMTPWAGFQMIIFFYISINGTLKGGPTKTTVYLFRTGVIM